MLGTGGRFEEGGSFLGELGVVGLVLIGVGRQKKGFVP